MCFFKLWPHHKNGFCRCKWPVRTNALSDRVRVPEGGADGQVKKPVVAYNYGLDRMICRAGAV